MNAVEYMISAKECSAVAYQEYLVSKDKFKYFGFIEGKDDYYLYYDIFSKNFSSGQFRLVKCGGKRVLAEIINIIEKDKNKPSTMFFMDGDYNNKCFYGDISLKYGHDFYILDVYSIENLFSGSGFLKKILVREYGMEHDSDDLNNILSEYDEYIKSQEVILKEFNMFCYIQRVIRNNDFIDFSCIKNEIPYKKQKELTMDNLCSYYHVEEISLDERKAAESFFAGKNFLSYCRGHNLLITTKEFINQIHKKNISHKYKKKYEVIGFCGDSILNHCTYAVEIPESLIDFVLKHK